MRALTRPLSESQSRLWLIHDEHLVAGLQVAMLDLLSTSALRAPGTGLAEILKGSVRWVTME